MYIFSNIIEQTITFRNPFICSLEEVINYNPDNNIAIISLRDNSRTLIIGFVYNKFAELLANRHVQNRLPFKISIISGKIIPKGDNLTFEIYQCIFEKDFLINSSSLASHSYCEMATYLSSHIHAYSPYNPAQIFGNIYHDYLMFVFEDEALLKLTIGDPLIRIKVETAFQKAILRNWQSLAAFNVNEQNYYNYFKQYYSRKEVEFIEYELQKFRNYGDDYSFQAEVMTRSSYYGLQGRIDRILWNRTNNSFTLYETKTGRTSFASENTAKFQLMAYSLILREYYTKELEELVLEYPRNSLRDRLKIIEFDENEIIRLVNMRNEIWAISIGRRPKDGPFKRCSSKCFQTDACSFYCLRSYLTTNCLNCDLCNYHPILFNQEDFEEFRRVNVYYDWFYQFLEMEYLNNQDLLSELGLVAQEREMRGNCFANVVISQIDKTMGIDNQNSTISSKFWITFIRDPSENPHKTFVNTRMNVSDRVLITPQNYRPLTLQSIPAIIYKLQNDFVILEVSSDYFSTVSNNVQDESFRIDIVATNWIVNMEKTALDSFIRIPYLSGNESLRKIRSYLINFNTITQKPAKHIKISSKLRVELENKDYNSDQIDAISRALSFSDVLLIQGPPGTGKTTVISEIVYQLVQKLKSTPNFVDRGSSGKTDQKSKMIMGSSMDFEKIPDFEFTQIPITKKILLTAYTNRAVDTLIEMLLRKFPQIDILRLGTELSLSPKVKTSSLEYLTKTEIILSNGEEYEGNSSQKAHNLIRNATVIATTCLGANSVLLQDIEFEYVVIDEAGQVIEPAALIPVLKAKRVILVGDDAQLPPISVKEQNPLLDLDYFADKNYLQGFYGTIIQYQKNISTAENRKKLFLQELSNLGIEPLDTLSVSLFQRLKRKMDGRFQFVFLTKQYRMHTNINRFISDWFYEGKLHTGTIHGINIGTRTISEFYSYHQLLLKSPNSNPSDPESLFFYIFNPQNPMIFLDTKSIDAYDSKLDKNFDEMNSKFNTREAQILSFHVSRLILTYLDQHPTRNDLNFREFLSNIGIITPYRAQVRLIRSLVFDSFSEMKKIQELVSNYLLIDTVDKFQGKESELIFISLVDSNPSKEVSSLYSELRRLNVSITRAKTKLIFIGNSETFISKSPSTHRRTIMDYLEPSSISFQELSNDSDLEDPNLKSNRKIHRFFVDLVKYIQTHQGYVILDEKMITKSEK